VVARAGEVTRLLHGLKQGDRAAESRLLEMVYGELHRIAQRYMRGERDDHTLQATALVNEAYLRLVDQKDKTWQNRAHFFAVAAQVMRRILVDYARQHCAQKRGGIQQKLELDADLLISQQPSEMLLLLDGALERLKVFDPRQSRVIELRFFGGLTNEETAEVMGIGARTVKRDWQVAKSWLYGEMVRGPSDEPGEMEPH
jgi:RNA polymerase sigma-70 factor (ECF subfamily)